MRLLKAFSKYAIGTAFVLLIGFITTPILTRLISTTEMGKYSMFMTFGNLISTLLCFGLDQSYLRFFYAESKESRTYLLRRCMAIPLWAFLTCSMIILVLYGPISVYLAGEKSMAIAGLFIAYIGGMIIDRFWSLKIQMAQKEIAYSALNFIRKLGYLVVAVFLILVVGKWQDGTNLMIAITAAEVFVLLFARIVERGDWKIRKKEIHESYHELLQYGLPFVFSSTITLIFHSTDKIMLKALSDYHNIGIYSGAQNIVNLLSQAQAVFVAFWVPTVYEHYEKNKEDRTFYVLMNKIVSYAMLMILIALICMKDFVVLLLGEEYRDACNVFPFLAFMPVMYTISETTVMGINFMKKTGYHLYISMISMLVNAFGNFVFITMYGAKGAAIATGLSYSVFFILRTYFSNKVFPVPYAWKRYGVAALLVYFLAFYASFYPVTGFFILLAVIVVAVITFLYRDIIIQGGKMLSEFIRIRRM